MTKEEREKRIDELLESIKDRVTVIVENTRAMILEEQAERKALEKRLETWEYHFAREKSKR